MAKLKERETPKSHKRKSDNYKGAPIRLSSDLLTETFQARREWCEIFKEMKSKYLQPRLLYPTML